MSTSTTSIESDQLEAGILYESKEIERVLYQLNREVYQIKWIDAFKEGWRTIESRHGKNRTLAYKVGTVFGSITIVIPLSGASIMFGALALKQGIEEIKLFSKAPIIGHFSEWTIQGVFIIGVFLQGLNKISYLGEQMLAQKIYHRFLVEQGLSQEKCEAVYADYLKSIPAASLPKCPSPQTGMWESEAMHVDSQLRETFEELEYEIDNLSFIQKLREGWKIIKAEKSRLILVCIKSSMVAGGIFATVHLINYPLGIYWAGEQAIEDYKAGENPNIGGHTLEWGLECIALINGIYYYMRDLANVGRAKLISDLFRKKAESAFKSSVQQGSRIMSEMQKQVHSLSEKKGFFFTVPSWLMFKNEREANPA